MALWRTQLSFEASSTTIDFDSVTHGTSPFAAELTARSVGVALERRFVERLTLQLAAGAADGALTSASSRHELESGWTAAGSVSYRVLDAEGFVPFVLPGVELGVVHAATADRYEPTAARGLFRALDLRLGVIAGARLLDTVRPFAGARFSGGPVRWRRGGAADAGGVDRRRYEVPVGVRVGPMAAAGRGPISAFDGFIEGVVFGQRGVTVGLGCGF